MIMKEFNRVPHPTDSSPHSTHNAGPPPCSGEADQCHRRTPPPPARQTAAASILRRLRTPPPPARPATTSLQSTPPTTLRTSSSALDDCAPRRGQTIRSTTCLPSISKPVWKFGGAVVPRTLSPSWVEGNRPPGPTCAAENQALGSSHGAAAGDIRPWGGLGGSPARNPRAPVMAGGGGLRLWEGRRRPLGYF
jgi:hypothetical protein